MKEGPDIARVAALIGDPARANMLTALMTGKALTAAELAAEAGITAQTASSHLAQLQDGGLLRLRKQGRHKYFSLANDDVAAVLEKLMGIAAAMGHLRTRTGPKDGALRKARVCYNHLAGEMGTRMHESLLRNRHLVYLDKELKLTASGYRLAREIGIDVAALEARKTPLCRECLDWSERKSHLAGSLGRAFMSRFEELGWARREPPARAVTFTRSGLRNFDRLFG